MAGWTVKGGGISMMLNRSSKLNRTLLAELRLTLLVGSHDHVAAASSREAVEASTDLVDGNNVQVLGAAVVGTVHDSADGETEGHLELGARRTGR